MTIDRDALREAIKPHIWDDDGVGGIEAAVDNVLDAVIAHLSATPIEGERERIEQSNEIAHTVIEAAQKVHPDLFITLDLRYGIADALWVAGYRKAGAPRV